MAAVATALNDPKADKVCELLDEETYLEKVLSVLSQQDYRFRVAPVSTRPEAQPVTQALQLPTTTSPSPPSQQEEVMTPTATAKDAAAAGYTTEASPAQVETLRQKLTKFYTEHNPKKLETLTVFVNYWAGKEATLNMLLRERYGIDMDGHKLSSILSSFYQEHNPEKTKDAERIATQYGKDERALCRALRHNYTKDYNNHTLEILLNKFYGEVNPKKAGDIPKLVKAFKQKEDDLNAQLRQTYGKDLCDLKI